jgi:glycosyltransferase involved in cell wall biosynthesis
MNLENNLLAQGRRIEVSVLMTVYNTDITFVKRAIQSVLAQSFQQYELIIIDDGSESETYLQLIAYLEDISRDIIYIRHHNRGQSDSINRGIKYSQGRYIAILDADDEYKPDYLGNCLAAVKNADLIASTTHTIVDHEEDYFVPDRTDQRQSIHVDDCILFATLFGRKEVFADIGFENKYAADAYFFERAGLVYDVKKVDLRSYIYYRNNPASICNTRKREARALFSRGA